MNDPILRSVGAPFQPATIPILEGEITIGRAEDRTISLPSKAVSRAHARLRRSGDRLTIEDLGSRNGTRKNGAAVEGTAEVQIGDRLRFGEFEFVVERPPAESEAATLFDGGDDLAATALAPPSAVPVAAPPPPPAPIAPATPPPPPPPPAAPPTVLVPPLGKADPSVSVRTVTPPTMIAPEPAAKGAAAKAPSGVAAPAAKPASPAPSRAVAKTADDRPSFLGLSLIAIAAYGVVVAAGYAWWMLAP